MAKRGLYANIHAKRKRIAAGSGEKMRKPGAKGAPTNANFKRAAKTAKKKNNRKNGDPNRIVLATILIIIMIEYGKKNIYPNEPPIQLLPPKKLMSPEAERFNGWAAMLGFVAAVGAYATTGQIIPGVF